MNREAAQKVFGVENKIIETDIDIYHHILFQYKFAMFSPASKYGLPEKDCLFRLCVNDDLAMNKLHEVIDNIKEEVEVNRSIIEQNRGLLVSRRDKGWLARQREITIEPSAQAAHQRITSENVGIYTQNNRPPLRHMISDSNPEPLDLSPKRSKTD